MPSQLQKVMSVTLQSCAMSIASNVIAQSLTAYKTNTSFTIDWKPIFQFLIFTILSTPPNYLFQQYLEYLLPSQKVVPSPVGVSAASKSASDPTPSLKEEASAPLVQTKLNIKNTVAKFLIDQTFCATANTLGFTAGMAGIRGVSTGEAWGQARREYWGMMTAGWKLWPFVSLANYSVVKTVEARQLVGGLAGLGWGVFLALRESGNGL